MEMSAAPHGPTTASSTEAIELSGRAASSSWVSTPKERADTLTSRASTERKPITVARPMSRRERDWREYTEAPSMPMNTHTVKSMVP